MPRVKLVNTRHRREIYVNADFDTHDYVVISSERFKRIYGTL